MRSRSAAYLRILNHGKHGITRKMESIRSWLNPRRLVRGATGLPGSSHHAPRDGLPSRERDDYEIPARLWLLQLTPR